MRAHPLARLSLLLAAALGACGGSTTPDHAGPAASIAITSGNGQTAVVASVLPTPLAVTVTDAKSRPVPGIAVTWGIAAGNGVITPNAPTTDANGVAQAVLSVGTTAGTNQVSASVSGVATPAMFSITGTAGPLAQVILASHTLALCDGGSSRSSATTDDLYGNVVTGTVTWVSRNPAIATVDASGNVQLVSTTGSTYIVATSGSAKADSLLVSATAGVSLAVGQVMDSLSSSSVCVQSNQPGSQFALVAYNGSTSVGTAVGIQVQGTNVSALGSGANLVPSPSAALVRPGAPPVKVNEAFEYALRERERREMPQYVGQARAWATQVKLDRARGIPTQTPLSRASTVSGQISGSVTVGSYVKLNNNATDYCSNPTFATGRVAAISNSAIVVSDTLNPPGGFTDAEYMAFATAMDTLVNPVDTSAFGAPWDIDGSHHTVIFFTRAVNQLTTDPTQGIVLGFYYSRDLLPLASCPGSNVANMFYLLVPDPNRTINGGNTFSSSKTSVSNIVVSTIGHEYQHLINASRRTYILNVPAANVNEETWLNEGLSHTAEDLIFYRSAGLTPRQNINASTITGSSQVANAFTLFEAADASRYQTYLTGPETHAPVGVEGDDNLYLRGAIQSYLRYICDRLRTTDGDFWYKLVNDTLIGLPNLQHAIGTDPEPLFRDWATSVFTDDFAPGIATKYTQPSWNWREVMPLERSAGFSLLTHPLSSGVPVGITVTARGVGYFPFAVANGQSALISVLGTGGGSLASSMQLTLIRTK